MSLADDALDDGFRTHTLAVFGNEFIILSGPSAGTSFIASDEVANAINTPFLVDEDMREVIVLHSPVAVDLQKSGQVSGLGSKWTVIRIEDNPSDTSVDYWLKRIVSNVDT